MIEICYFLANDGKKFDDRWDCVEYERRKELEAHRDEFQFFNHRREPIPVEEATTEDVIYIVVKSDDCVEAIGSWYDNDGCFDPFDGVRHGCVGTWVYGETIGKDEGWFKLEAEIELIQSLIDEVHQQ